MAEVRAHPWVVNGPVPTSEQIQHEFAQRKSLIDQENEAKRIAKEAEKAAALHSAHPTGRRQYKNVGVHRSEGEEGAEEAKHELVIRKCDQYYDQVKKNTEFFSTLKPEELFGEIAGFLQDEGHQVTLDNKKFKLKATLKPASDEDDEEEAQVAEAKESSEEESVEITVKILQVPDSDKYCVEFNRNSGDQLCFFEAFNRLRTEFADLANATR